MTTFAPDVPHALQHLPYEKLQDLRERFSNRDDPRGPRLLIQQCMDYARNDVDFAIWLGITSQTVFKRSGVFLFDLPDMTLRDWYDDGMRPREAAGIALEGEGWCE